MTDPRILNGAEALREAMDQAMAADPAVFLMGEGATDPKGVFGTTAGLIDQYGPERVIEMPVAENGLTGVAIGAALMGRRPVMVHQRVEFALLALEQIINNAAKMRFVSAGAHTVPLVIRLIIGRGWGQGPSHSQVLAPLFAHVPGLKVAMPVFPADAKGLLLAAISDDDPVVLIEHRWCHSVQGEVPEAALPAPLAGPRRVRDGHDVTLVGVSHGVLELMEVADALARVDIAADVFDLRVLRPLDAGPVIDSVRRTGRLAFLDVGWTPYGVGAELIARVVESAYGALCAPPVRLGLKDHPTPSSRALAADYYPGSLDVVRSLRAVLPPGAQDQLDQAEGWIASRRSDHLIDVPYAAFKGPF